MAAEAQHGTNLALQGGGSHGAFTWGVLDRLLESGRFRFDAISGTSAGAMNAIVMAEGLIDGGAEVARQRLERFWLAIADEAAFISPFRRTMAQTMSDSWAMSDSYFYEASLAFTRMFSPYQFNPLGFNPLKEVLERLVNFDKVRKQREIRLFINTTQVRTGGLRCWREHELTVDMVLASACLPWLFQAPVIDGEAYWDGGYVANPALAPMLRCTTASDVLIVQLNPIVRHSFPRTAYEIEDRMNEITFNSSLLTELRFIAERNRLIEAGELVSKRERLVHLHMIHDDNDMREFPPSSKLVAERDFLLKLKELGRMAADRWLKQGGRHLGKKSSFDYHRLVARLTQETDDGPDAGLLSGPVIQATD